MSQHTPEQAAKVIAAVLRLKIAISEMGPDFKLVKIGIDDGHDGKAFAWNFDHTYQLWNVPPGSPHVKKIIEIFGVRVESEGR